jgi:hypothetical protein
VVFLELGYRLLAEAFIKQRRLEDAYMVLDKLSTSTGKSILLRELRNNAARSGNLDMFQKTSRIAGLDASDISDLASILLINVINNKLSAAIEVINLLPEGEMKQHLIIASILCFAQKGSIIACEKISEASNIPLSKEQALIAKINAVREGWISDAERAAELAGVELSQDDYKIMMIANKDKGLLLDAQEAAKRAGEEIDDMVLITLLLSGVTSNRESVWDIAEMI